MLETRMLVCTKSEMIVLQLLLATTLFGVQQKLHSLALSHISIQYFGFRGGVLTHTDTHMNTHTSGQTKAHHDF